MGHLLSRSSYRSLAVAVLASGFSGLMYQVLWTRRLSLIFGYSILAVSAVLTIFMLGLGLGARLAGDRIDQNPGAAARTYCRLELLLGIWGLLSIPLFSLLEQAYYRLASLGWSSSALTTAGLIGASLLLLLPTVAMGATLPVLCRIEPDPQAPPGSVLSAFYGLNTLGACLGAGAAGFLFLPWLGLFYSVLIASAGNFLAAGLVFWSRPTASEAVAETGPRQDPQSVLRVTLAFALGGAASMIYQVGWTRGLILSVGSSTYSFAAILTVFLACLGAGSLLFLVFPARMIRRAKVATIGWTQLAVAGTALLTVPLLGLLPRFYFMMFSGSSGGSLAVLSIKLFSVVVLLAPCCLLMGLLFPLATQVLVRDHGELGEGLGKLYLANTLGCVVGALAAGFLLLPGVGVQWTLKLGVLLSLSAGLVLLEGRRLAWICGLALVLLTLLLPRWNPSMLSAGISIYADAHLGRTITELQRRWFTPPAFYRDGLTSTVSVHIPNPNARNLRVNGKVDASLQRNDQLTMYLAALIGGLYHPNPRDTAVIGLGSGITLRGLADLRGVERIDCVELEPAVVEAAPYWTAYNGAVLEDPRTRLHVMDGRTFVQTARGELDLLVSEPSNPWIAGIANLYTVEFFQSCSEALRPDGVMVQWFHLYNVSEDDIKTVFASFFQAFPHGTVWVTAPGDILLVGTKAEKPLDLEQLHDLDRSFPEEAKVRLHQLGLTPFRSILGHFLMTRETALQFARGASLNTDDRPVLEYSAPWGLNRAGLLSDNMRKLFSLRRQKLPPGAGESLELQADAALSWLKIGDADQARELVRQNPGRTALLEATLLQLFGGGQAAQRAFQVATERSEGVGKSLALLYWADFEFEQDRYRNAFLLYRQYLASQPDTPLEGYLLTRMANCLVKLGRYKPAHDILLKALKRSPEDTRASLLLGLTLERMDLLSEAQEQLLKVLERDPTDLEARLALAQIHFRRREYLPALRAYNEALELKPDEESALVNLGICFFQLDNRKEARKAFRRALFHDPDNDVARRNLRLLDN